MSIYTDNKQMNFEKLKGFVLAQLYLKVGYLACTDPERNSEQALMISKMAQKENIDKTTRILLTSIVNTYIRAIIQRDEKTANECQKFLLGYGYDIKKNDTLIKSIKDLYNSYNVMKPSEAWQRVLSDALKFFGLTVPTVDQIAKKYNDLGVSFYGNNFPKAYDFFVLQQYTSSIPNTPVKNIETYIRTVCELEEMLYFYYTPGSNDPFYSCFTYPGVGIWTTSHGIDITASLVHPNMVFGADFAHSEDINYLRELHNPKHNGRHRGNN